MKTRRYCWRVGSACEQEDGTVCEECGEPWDAGKPKVDGCFERVYDGSGLHCTLPPDHEGPHRWEE